MISNDLLKTKILELAISGRLVENNPSLPAVEVDEINSNFNFEIPQNWKWVRYGNIADSKMGKTILRSDLIENGIPVYSATQQDKIFGFVKKSDLLLKKGDIVIPARGNSIGYAMLVNDEVATCTQTTICSTNISKVNSKYLVYCCQYFRKIWFKFSGAAIPQVTIKQINNNILPLPPKEEQELIVNKLEEIFALIDKKSKNDNDIDRLKKTLKNKILDEAINGTLVENDLTLPSIDLTNYVDKGPYDLPFNWRWSKLMFIGTSKIGLTYSPADVNDNGIIVLRSSNIKNGKLVLEDIVRVKCKINDTLYVQNNDILICARNGSKSLVGKSAILTDIKEKMTFGAFMALYSSNYNSWVYWFMQSKFYYYQLAQGSNTMTINQLTQKHLNNILIPIPPREEQKKIVDRIEQLFYLIDKL